MELIDEVYAFPAGFSPRGCDGIASAGIDSSSGGKEAHLSRFMGRSSEQERLDWRMTGAIVGTDIVDYGMRFSRLEILTSNYITSRD